MNYWVFLYNFNYFMLNLDLSREGGKQLNENQSNVPFLCLSQKKLFQYFR